MANIGISNKRAIHILRPVLRGMPEFAGDPISVQFLRRPTAHRGKLLSGSSLGTPVHAGSHLQRREMFLDSDLLLNRLELIRIFVHEVYHFFWARLGKVRRKMYEDLVHAEMQAGARGELGWSAQLLKNQLTPTDRKRRTRRWREYVCESFCDTGAWSYSSARTHPEWTLAESRRRKRAECLVLIIEGGEFRV